MAITSSRWWPVAAMRLYSSPRTPPWPAPRGRVSQPKESGQDFQMLLSTIVSSLNLEITTKCVARSSSHTRLPTDRRSRVHVHRTTAAGDCENRNSSRVHNGPDENNNRRNPTKSNRDSKNGTRNKELPDEVKGPLGTGLPTKQRGRGRDRG